MNLYLHVPFCAQRCSYCDFYTITNLRLRADYLKALKAEIALTAEQAPTRNIQHLYIGGGTPSMLSIDELAQIRQALDKHYHISSTGEITIECNPDDITLEYAEGLAQIGFNRVSMGVQSFQPQDLTFLNRRHSVEQVYASVDFLHKAGINNLSLDLIYGLPNQTEETWTDNIHQILSLAVPHISAYHLIYEEGTPLTHLRNKGKIKEISEEHSLRFFEILIHELRTHGYEHYEISNFAKPGQYAQLNMGYWFGAPYIGLGPSAHSFDGSVRSHNIASIRTYTEALRQGHRHIEIEVLTPQEQRHEYIMTRLRTQWGIDLREYEAHFGPSALSNLHLAAQPYIDHAQLQLTDSVLSLTDQGVFISDSIIVDLFD